jgi:hypothetical protein
MLELSASASTARAAQDRASAALQLICAN